MAGKPQFVKDLETNAGIGGRRDSACLVPTGRQLRDLQQAGRQHATVLAECAQAHSASAQDAV